MEKVLLEADELVKVLTDSSVYQNYLSSKRDLQPSDVNLLSEYKSLHFKFVEGQASSFDDEKIISSLYSRLMLNLRTRSFLQNELLLTQCLKRIYEKIGAGIKLDVFA